MSVWQLAWCAMLEIEDIQHITLTRVPAITER